MSYCKHTNLRQALFGMQSPIRLSTAAEHSLRNKIGVNKEFITNIDLNKDYSSIGIDSCKKTLSYHSVVLVLDEIIVH